MVLKLSSGETIKTKATIIATGASALWMGLENEQRLRGRGISACATCDGFFFRDKEIAVVGGGDTAMEETSFLTKFAKKIYIIHRRSEFRASKIMQERVLKNPKIEVLWNTIVEDVLGEDKVEGLKIKNVQSGRVKEKFPIDGLFLAIGHKPDTEFLKDSGVLLDKKGYVKTAAWVAWEIQNEKIKNEKDNFEYKYQYATSVSGVFAAGDCVDYVYRQAGTAVGMGIAAALEVERYLADK